VTPPEYFGPPEPARRNTGPVLLPNEKSGAGLKAVKTFIVMFLAVGGAIATISSIIFAREADVRVLRNEIESHETVQKATEDSADRRMTKTEDRIDGLYQVIVEQRRPSDVRDEIRKRGRP
jgi:hypothetical protein